MAQETEKLSPMLKQYLDIKKKYSDYILFFRLGDFYEMFFEDAENVSRELELALTSRAGSPMCGVPYHSCEIYIKKLIDKGYKVAICEQLTDPAASKGLVERDVIRLVTAGTVIEASMLNEDSNNYIACVFPDDNGTSAALVFADISTGEVQDYGFIKSLSMLAWGLGYFGMPHILVRFMSIKKPSMIRKSSTVAIVWVIISLLAAVLIAYFGRMVMGEELLTAGNQKLVFIAMSRRFFPAGICGLLLAAIIAASISTADSQLLAAASSVSQDLMQDFFGIKLDEEANNGCRGQLKRISAPDSRVEVWIVPTNEELLIARDTLSLISK